MPKNINFDKEGNVVKQQNLDFTKNYNGRLFRNNVGMGWQGEIIARKGKTITLKGAHPLYAGLVVGSGDQIGWRTITITPDMVGQTIAQFVSVESKVGKRGATEEQKNWYWSVIEAGGYAVISNDPFYFAVDKCDE